MSKIKWKYFKPEESPEQKLIKTTLTSGEEMFPAYCGEKLNWYEESWNGDPNSPFVFAVRKYYNMVYDHIAEDKPLIITLDQVRQQITIINEAHRQNPQFDIRK